jgi:hypothetical protein
MTFSVEIADAEKITTSSHHVEIHIDKSNLKDLIIRLTRLSEQPLGEHLHFMSESWGLGDLSEISQGEGNVITHHLKISITE